MTAKDFLDGVTGDRENILERFLGVLENAETSYCVIGGLAVNAYVEPLVSLDLGVVVAADRLEAICAAATAASFSIEHFPFSLNLYATGSDVRI